MTIPTIMDVSADAMINLGQVGREEQEILN